jgi:hypothetical protein
MDVFGDLLCYFSLILYKLWICFILHRYTHTQSVGVMTYLYNDGLFQSFIFFILSLISKSIIPLWCRNDQSPFGRRGKPPRFTERWADVHKPGALATQLIGTSPHTHSNNFLTARIRPRTTPPALLRHATRWSLLGYGVICNQEKRRNMSRTLQAKEVEYLVHIVLHRAS